MIGIFYGSAKPTPVSDYLSDFIEEYKQIVENGYEFLDKLYKISLKAFICDTPARSFLKCTKGHNGYHCCERCTSTGVYKGRIVFNEINADKRTDGQFKAYFYEDPHQLSLSPLAAIGFPCVSGFCLDYMHLVCLGVVRRIISFWKGAGNRQFKLSQVNWLIYHHN